MGKIVFILVHSFLYNNTVNVGVWRTVIAFSRSTMARQGNHNITWCIRNGFETVISNKSNKKVLVVKGIVHTGMQEVHAETPWPF